MYPLQFMCNVVIHPLRFSPTLATTGASVTDAKRTPVQRSSANWLVPKCVRWLRPLIAWPSNWIRWPTFPIEIYTILPFIFTDTRYVIQLISDSHISGGVWWCCLVDESATATWIKFANHPVYSELWRLIKCRWWRLRGKPAQWWWLVIAIRPIKGCGITGDH